MKTENIAGYLLKSTGAAVEIERYGLSKLIVKLDAKSITLSQLINMIETCDGKGNCTISIIDGKLSIDIPLRKGAKLGFSKKERKEIYHNTCDSSPISSRAYYSDAMSRKEVIIEDPDDDKWFEKKQMELMKEIEESMKSSPLDELNKLVDDST